MKITASFFFSGALVMLFSTCQPKEDLTPVKIEVSKLRTSWVASQESLTQVMTDLKNASRTVNDDIVRLQKIIEGTNPYIRMDARKMLADAEEHRKEIKAQMDDLNIVIHDWSDRSKKLNNLIEVISDEQITIALATEKMNELRDFQVETTPKFESVTEFLNSKDKDIRRMNSFVRKYE